LASHDRLGNTARKTGFWLEEFAAPYFVFRDAGVELTLASPRGGQPLVEPKSDLPENQTPAMARFKKDSAAQNALAHTGELAGMKAEEFDTVFYVGGHDPMWDLPFRSGAQAAQGCGGVEVQDAALGVWSFIHLTAD
jgi:putative intracellular protease/amidase